MRDTGGSKTAVGAALMRAVHQVLDPQPRWIEDPLAVGFVPGSSAEEIAARREELNAEVWRYMRAEIIKRDRAAEKELESAVGDGIEQYILLGAGFDTFPYRQPRWARSLSIIEVDHPTSQALKRRCLAARALAIPANVELCPLDFEHQSLETGLAKSRFDSGLPAYLSWLGVTPYLSRPAITRVLRFVLSLPPSSRIVFSFCRPTTALDGAERAAMEQVEAFTDKRGEPLLTRFEVWEMMTWLEELGFTRSWIVDKETPPPAEPERSLPHITFGKIVCAVV